jgi:carbon-monoxide dehydrogenase iron sulfur subunit
MRNKLISRPRLCVNCRICEMACSLSKTGVFNPVKARIWIHRNKKGSDMPMICRHCTSPLCEKACPVGAILIDNENGIVRVSLEDCIGCYECVKACPFSAIRVDPDSGYVFKCDLCGGDPECVKWCPTEAIKYVGQGAIGTWSAVDKF